MWIKNKGRSLVCLAVAVLIGGCSGMQYQGGESFDAPKEINSDHQGLSILVHMKSGLEPDDTQPCVAFNVAAGFLVSGYDVAILIDAGSNGDFLGDSGGASAKWSKYELPESMIDAVSAQLHIPVEEFPKTYMEYLEWMESRGVAVYMNGTMNLLLGKADQVKTSSKVPAFIKLISLPEMAKLVAESDRYIAY